MVYFQKEALGPIVYNKREVFADPCQCRTDDMVLYRIGEKNLVKVNRASKHGERFLYDLPLEDFDAYEFTCDIYNVLRAGKEQKIISFALDKQFSLGEASELIRKVASLVKNVYPLWTIRVYYDSKNGSSHNLKCEHECKYANVDFCDVNTLDRGLWKNVEASVWKYLPVGDSFVEAFSARSLTKWRSIIHEFNLILEWLNSRRDESHLFRRKPNYSLTK